MNGDVTKKLRWHMVPVRACPLRLHRTTVRAIVADRGTGAEEDETTSSMQAMPSLVLCFFFVFALITAIGYQKMFSTLPGGFFHMPPHDFSLAACKDAALLKTSLRLPLTMQNGP